MTEQLTAEATAQLTAEAVAINTCVDVGRQSHHAVALDRSGRRLYDKALPNDEGQLRALTPACAATERCCWWWTSPPPAVPCP